MRAGIAVRLYLVRRGEAAMVVFFGMLCLPTSCILETFLMRCCFGPEGLGRALAETSYGLVPAIPVALVALIVSQVYTRVVLKVVEEVVVATMAAVAVERPGPSMVKGVGVEVAAPPTSIPFLAMAYLLLLGRR